VRAADLYASYAPIGPSPGVVRARVGPASGSPAILDITSRSCESWLGGLLTVTSVLPPATKAIAAAAEGRVTAVAVRRYARKEFGRPNQRGVFIEFVRIGLR